MTRCRNHEGRGRFGGWPDDLNLGNQSERPARGEGREGREDLGRIIRPVNWQRFSQGASSGVVCLAAEATELAAAPAATAHVVEHGSLASLASFSIPPYAASYRGVEVAVDSN